MELALAALPFLAFLACPLMMLFCVVGMRKMGCSTPRTTEAQIAGQTREEQVAALEGQLATIQSGLAALRAAEGQPDADRSPRAIRAEILVPPR